MITGICKRCGKKITRNGNKKPVFCDIDCKAAWQRTQKSVDRDWLWQKYIVEEMGTYQISQLVNRNPKQVYNWLKGYNIPLRERKWDITPHPSEKFYQDKKWLFEQYVTKQRTTTEIAEDFDVTPRTIVYWLRKHNIQTRTISETRKIKFWSLSGEINGMYGVTGEDNPNWKGGCTPERQAVYSSIEWGKAVKAVWERDQKICQRCNKVWKWGKSYHIHHIISFSVRELRTNPDNLVLLCESCHRWVHSPKNTEEEWLKSS